MRALVAAVGVIGCGLRKRSRRFGCWPLTLAGAKPKAVTPLPLRHRTPKRQRVRKSGL
jgi:hypothetical protein